MWNLDPLSSLTYHKYKNTNLKQLEYLFSVQKNPLKLINLNFIFQNSSVIIFDF